MLPDQIAFACAFKHSQVYCVTASVNTVDFLSPIEIGELVTMKASVNYTGRSSIIIGIRVEAGNIVNGRKKHCNSSYFTMVAKDNKVVSIHVPGLILKNDHDIRRFIKSIERNKTKEIRQKEFHETDFSSEEYLQVLKEHHVKIRR